MSPRIVRKHGLRVRIFRNATPVFSIRENKRVKVCFAHIMSSGVKAIDGSTAAFPPDAISHFRLHTLGFFEEFIAERALRDFILVFSYSRFQLKSRSYQQAYHRMEQGEMSNNFTEFLQCPRRDIPNGLLYYF
jgi:hypothetical protein